MRTSIPVVLTALVLAFSIVRCDSTRTVEDCVGEPKAPQIAEFIEVFDETRQPRQDVAQLEFYQDITAFAGVNCQRPDSSSTTLFVDAYSLWKSVSMSFNIEFVVNELIWSYNGVIVEQLPLQSVNIGIISADSTPLDNGTLSGVLTSPVVYSEPEEPTYKVTQGACGHVAFREHLASNLEAAISIIQAREIDRRPEANLAFERSKLEVVDQFGAIPVTEFWRFWVDPDTGSSLQSMSNVVSSNGDGYWLAWCPD